MNFDRRTPGVPLRTSEPRSNPGTGRRVAGSRLAAIAAAMFLVVVPKSVRGHLDILVFQKEEALRLGAYDFGSSEILEDHRVFTTGLETQPGFPGGAFSDDPGWNSVRDNFPFFPEGVTTLPGGVALEFEFLAPAILQRNLAYWDGTGDVTFGGPPENEVVRYANSLLPSDAVVVDGSNKTVPGFRIAVSSPGGYVHRHFTFTLFGNAAMDGNSDDVPSPGVYLVALAATVEGFPDSSNAAFVLLGHDVDLDVLTKAAETVERHSASCQLTSDPGVETPPTGHTDIIVGPEAEALAVDGVVHTGNIRASEVSPDGRAWATDNPGFAGSGFQFQDEIWFDITGPLRRWDGVNWSASNLCSEQVEFLEPGPFGEPLNSVTVDGATELAEGFRISRAGTRGTIHNHYTFVLRSTDDAIPQTGAYAFPVVLRSPQYADSSEVHLVFNSGLSESAFAYAVSEYRRAATMRLGIDRTAPAGATLEFPTLSGRLYRFEAAPDLTGPWEALGPDFVGGDQDFQTTVALSGSRGFFRVRRIDPPAPSPSENLKADQPAETRP